MAKIVILSDYNFKGSGYLNIVVPLCTGLANLGHEIKAIGLGYSGTEHDLPFSIIPCSSFFDAQAMMNNLIVQWGSDIVITALDIPYLGQFNNIAKQLGKKFIAITPLENPPLTMSWTVLLQQCDRVFFISELGKQEAIKSGLFNAEHLLVGMDTTSWRMRTPEEYKEGRKLFNISEDTLVVLTVADNQERKNLSKAMEIVSKVKNEHNVKVKYILVTRENSDVGWKLRDLALDLGIANDIMIFERGMSFGELYSLYAISDAFLLTSKAEGLGMPVMEAMSVGVPVVATSCGAMPELLGGSERGLLMETEYSMIDPWGNSRRDFPSAESGVTHLSSILRGIDGTGNPSLMTRMAREYMESRKWDEPVAQVNKVIVELLDVKE